MGAPGCPEFACCTASMASVRMVLMHNVSSCLLVNVCSLVTMGESFHFMNGFGRQETSPLKEFINLSGALLLAPELRHLYG